MCFFKMLKEEIEFMNSNSAAVVMKIEGSDRVEPLHASSPYLVALLVVPYGLLACVALNEKLLR